ncbi:hypothetical protein GCM10010168_85960 [Actinoplanes ianthinogenes]|uniref:Terminase n=1 Tax=Actinoplanes ianthinogenes TaxID=122358 RepID=A0ABN6CK11_9ACTN|nr:terminase [Actinoplanes ianthinogenes]BCJ45327.1 hypothetical protein Aiant_59840 [Actinoplanes ianthinogenes]GGR53798.1 hypothetical protein GCM10010168_85960 [Actinoplanes ianthinogenes]
MTPADAALLYEHYGLTCPPRWGTARNFDRKTYGPKVAKIARALGTPLMPWQRYVVDTALEIDPETESLAYRGVDITVPRQSGKTSLILPVMIWRGMYKPRQRIVYGAQTAVAAREKWEDEHLVAMGAARSLKNRYRERKANGREAILWGNGSIQTLLASTEMAGHGKTLDMAALDEYFAQVDYRSDQAVGPAMITRADAQKWRLSTAGTQKSVPFNAMRKRGRAAIEVGRLSTIAFFDWCALPGMMRDDPATWRSCMPALCPAPVRGVCRCSREWRHTVTEPAIATELETYAEDLGEFDRAYLNISRELGELDLDPNVPTAEEWALLADPEAPGGEVLALAIDCTPDGGWTSIVAVGDSPLGMPLIKVLDHGAGRGWVPGRIRQLVDRLNPVCVVLDDKSAAGVLLLPLEKVGIKRMPPVNEDNPRQGPQRGQLWVPTVQQLGAACGSFTDAVRGGQLVHLGQQEMTIALDGAKTRPLGDGAWAWGRKIASADISPLVAGSLGLAGLERWRHLSKPLGVATARPAQQQTASMFRPSGRLGL